MDFGKTSEFEAIRKIPLTAASGNLVLLERVADIRTRHAPAASTRLNGQREITLIAEVEGYIPKIVERLRQKFQTIRLPEGYSIDFSGQYHVLVETANEMLLAVLCAVVLVCLIMAMRFVGSWLHPLVILVTIPIAVVGVVIALFVTARVSTCP